MSNSFKHINNLVPAKICGSLQLLLLYLTVFSTPLHLAVLKNHQQLEPWISFVNFHPSDMTIIWLQEKNSRRINRVPQDWGDRCQPWNSRRPHRSFLAHVQGPRGDIFQLPRTQYLNTDSRFLSSKIILYITSGKLSRKSNFEGLREPSM